MKYYALRTITIPGKGEVSLGYVFNTKEERDEFMRTHADEIENTRDEYPVTEEDTYDI